MYLATHGVEAIVVGPCPLRRDGLQGTDRPGDRTKPMANNVQGTPRLVDTVLLENATAYVR
jgi:hypothetical protein